MNSLYLFNGFIWWKCFFFIDKRKYIQRKEEAPKTVPSKYTESIQKQPKGSKPRGEERNNTSPTPT